MKAFILIASLLSLASASLAAPTRSPRIAKRAVSPPASDPFYQAPSGFESTSPGTILNNRTIDAALLGIVSLPVTAYQLLYRTNSANGTAIATVTTVFVPENATSPGRVVSFATAEDSSASSCAPSYNYQLADPQTDAIVSVETLILLSFINQGYIVTSADYEGPDSSFGAGRLEGQGVIDALRATLSFSPLELSSNTQVAGVGYSGGAIATGWAAALQPNYAPELNVVGWAHGGTPANLSGTLAFLDGTLFSGFGPAGIVGLASAYQNVSDLLNEIATPIAKAGISLIFDQQCAQTDIIAFAFEKLQSTVWQSAGDQLLYLPVVQTVAHANTLGVNADETPTAPLYIYHSGNDEIIPVVDADAMVNAYCANGVKSLVYERDVGPSEHASMEILGLPNVITFINDRFNGVAPQSGCSITNVTTTLFDPGYLGSGLEIILGYLVDIFETLIGDNDSIWTGNLSSQANSSSNTWVQKANETANDGGSSRLKW